MNKFSYFLFVVIALFVVNSAEAKKKKYPNGDYYEGEWKKKSPHGLGTMTYANGDIYYGNWFFGTKEGQGTMTYKNNETFNEYAGEWKADQPNGKGTMTYKDGSVYDGSWISSNINGYGTMAYAKHTEYKEYVGEWKDNKPNGKGKMTFKNGDVYDGNWNMGDIYGDGTLTYPNGDVLVGTWDADGHQGKLTMKNGSWYEGVWKDEKFVNGKCSIKDHDMAFEGEIKNGSYYNGKGEIKNGNDYYNGTWTNGKFNGTAKYDNGISYEGDLSASYIPSGTGKLSFKNTSAPPIDINGNIKTSLIPDIDVCLYGVWDNGNLNSLTNGYAKIKGKAFNIAMNNNKLTIDGIGDINTTNYKEIKKSLIAIVPKTTNNYNNQQQAIGDIYGQKLKDKVFLYTTTLDKFEPDMTLFFDVTAIEVLYAMGLNNNTDLFEYYVAIVNPKKLKRHDRGFLLQQNGIAEKFTRKKDYKYEIKNGYLLFGGHKYKFINNYTAIYDEERKLTIKLHSKAEAEEAMDNFSKIFTM